jgi:O-6-methylguanine DNA methyltransferase
LGEAQAPAGLRFAILGATNQAPDSYVRFESPIGECFVAFNPRGISAVMRAESDEEFERHFQDRFGRPTRREEVPPDDLLPILHDWTRARIPTSTRFDLRGLSEFEQAVLRKALEIPPGEVRPYSWVAREIGRPLAVRAVGSALGGNPVPLLIPCHRVIRRDGHVGNYGLGEAAKWAILLAEGADPETIEGLARTKTRFFGSDSTHIYCFPTCRHARRISTGHLVRFRSESDAEAAGYRPCKVCRPA